MKRYTKEFKNEIIQRFLKRETVASISYETKIPRNTIYRWISNYQKENCFPKRFINRTIDELQNRIEKLETLLKIINEVGVSPQAPLKEKLNAMAPFYQKYKVHWLCEAMQVDRGTFYNHLFRGKHGDTFHAQQKKVLKEAIQKIYDENRQIYGATKITAILKLQGYHTCENTVAMLMREMKIGSIRQQAKAPPPLSLLRNRKQADFENEKTTGNLSCSSWFFCFLV